jgi:hypothetical protein
VFFPRLETKFHSHKRQETKLKFHTFQALLFSVADGKTRDFENLLFFSTLTQPWCQCRPPKFEFSLFWWLVSCLYIMTMPCIMVTRHEQTVTLNFPFIEH